MSRPILFRLRGGFDAAVAFLLYMGHQVRDPFHILFDTARYVAEGGGIVRADQREHVGKTLDLQAEEGPHALCPFVRELASADAADVDAFVSAGDCVETGGENDQKA